MSSIIYRRALHSHWTAALLFQIGTSCLALLLFIPPHSTGFFISMFDNVRAAPPSGRDFTSSVVPRSIAPLSTSNERKSTISQAVLDKEEDSNDKSKGNIPLSLSNEQVMRPLERVADRILKSETVGVMDDLAAEAIDVVSTVMDGAGLAIVDIIDSLPKTINIMADTVDDMVRSADSLGRNMAVIVTTPARVVLTGLRPNSSPRNSLVRRRNAFLPLNETVSDKDNEIDVENQNSTKKSSDTGVNSSRARRPLLFSQMLRAGSRSLRRRSKNRFKKDHRWFRQGRRIDSADSDSSISHESEVTSEEVFNSGVGFGIRREGLKGHQLDKENQKDARETAAVPDVFSSRNLARSLLRATTANTREQRPQPNPLSGLLALTSLISRNRTRGKSSEERELTVFERNFQNSKTHESIGRLEDGFSSFLGRLLGTLYRNADEIDFSFSDGLRRILGGAPLSSKEKEERMKNGSRSQGAVNKSEELKTNVTTRAPIKFRLSFDDIDPAPAKNTDSSL